MTSRRSRVLIAFLIFATMEISSPHSHACLWDSETILQERGRFPTTLEIILGKFPRHSPAYYQWRLEDRLEKLKSSPDDDQILDDIAVSYERLGQFDKAIEIAEQQLERNPQRYESLANLGTFLIHDGQLEPGLGYIEKAIEVNPDAHFGREKYQAILVKYVLSKRIDGDSKPPLAGFKSGDGKVRHGPSFFSFLKKELESRGELESPYAAKHAIKGVLGMMRFSKHDSPILLEVLGDLLAAGSARSLAYRAYSSAANNVEDEEAQEIYQAFASDVLSLSIYSWNDNDKLEISESDIANDFAKELADADEWFAGVVADEKKWIESGKNVDEMFRQKYVETTPAAIDTNRIEEEEQSYSYVNPAVELFFGQAVLITLMTVGAVVAIALFLRRRSVVSRNP